MVDNLSLFPESQARRVRVPPADELVRKMRRMLRFNRMLMPHPKMQNWLSAKGATLMQVLATIKDGQLTSAAPFLSEDGDWTITIKRVGAGRRTYITVAVKESYFVVRSVS
jgi:hypothetical protein